MNCSTCRYELSQCLDGRLPSGRRTAVLQHAESCASCGRFWQELQAAQRLTLSLRSTSVSRDFREGLWERVQAGEGTPEAVFHQPVSLLTKARYTLAGAAAAALVLVGVTLLKGDPEHAVDNLVAQNDVTPRADQPDPEVTLAGGNLTGRAMRRSYPTFDQNPLFSAAKPLSLDVLAAETARQIEDRYADVAVGMRMMRNPAHDQAAAARIVLENARELRDFGELLLELSDSRRLFFTDSRVDADLRFAVSLLAEAGKLEAPSPTTVERFVAPALRRDRLATLSRAISLPPSIDPREELEDLLRLNTRRPEVFPKLFVVLGTPGTGGDLPSPAPGALFLMEDMCGPSWVAPRSQMHSSQLRVQIEIQHQSAPQPNGSETHGR